MRIKLYILALIGLFSISSLMAQTPRTITVVTQPNAVVWLNDVQRGKTDEGGKLTIKMMAAGVQKLRVRADGYKETSQNLTAAQTGEVKIALVKTTDPAEIAFQDAENLAATDREKAVAAYRKAISLRPKYAEAQVALARVLSAMNNLDGALKAIKDARKARPAYAEASAVEGRLYVSEGEDEKAIAAFKRAITEGKGFQPEAQTGLGLLYKEKAEAFASNGDLEGEEANYMLAVGYFKKAIAQLSGAPDAVTLYQFLGLAYERMKKNKEAIAVYEEFLRAFPDSGEATAVRSFIVQLKKQTGEQ